MEIKKYKTIPRVIEAVGPINLFAPWEEVNEIREWCNGVWWRTLDNTRRAPHYFQLSSFDSMMIMDGSYIYKDHHGISRSLHPDHFNEIYELDEVNE